MPKTKVLPLVITITDPPVEVDVRPVTSVTEVHALTAATDSESITIVLPPPSDS